MDSTSIFYIPERLNFKIIGQTLPNSKRTSGPIKGKLEGMVTYGRHCAGLQIELLG